MAKRWWYPLSLPTIGFEEVHAAIDVLQSGQTTMGERTEEFEEQFARYVDARYAVMVNSGSSADLLMAFAANHRQPCDVIIPAVTWPTHVWSWVMAGSKVRFVDVDGLNVTSAAILKEYRHADEMVSLVHLMGVPVDIRNAVCRITEDCCEALGAKIGGHPVGGLDEMATWSFFFSHHMTTMEGGAVTTNNPETASLLRSLRSHGWSRHEGGDPYRFVGPGFNVRPTEISAAIGLVQLARLDAFNKHRGENRDAFVRALGDNPLIDLPAVPEESSPSWFGIPMFVSGDHRQSLANYLEDNGVETRPILGGNLLRQPAFNRWRPQGPFPGADRVHDHGLYVGLHPFPDTGVERVAELINEFTARCT